MPAVSGSPTQLSTSVTTLSDLAGVPDDGFRDGDLAYVRSLSPFGTYQLHRQGNAPSGSVPAFSGNGFWAPLMSASPSAVVFRPGLPSEGIYVETWAEVEGLVTAADGAITLYVDSTNAPAVVPSTTVLDGKNLLTISPAAYAIVTNNVLTFEDGAQIRNLRSVQGNIIIEGTPTIRPMFAFDPNTWNKIFLLENGAIIQVLAGTTISPIYAQGIGIMFSPFEVVMRYGPQYRDSGTGIPLVSLGPGTTMILLVTDCFDAISLGQNLVGGDPSCFLLYLSDATGPRPSPTFLWSTFPAPNIFTLRIDKAVNLEPSSGSTADRPTDLMTGQMYFDTDLGIPVWWNGTAWVNATGAPA